MSAAVEVVTCEVCGSEDLVLEWAEDLQPHGEVTYSEGWRCQACGAVMEA